MLESLVTESRGLDTSSEVESEQDVTHDASSTPPDTSRVPTISDANKTSPVAVPNGPVIPLETSSEASAVGVDVPLESDAAVDEDLDLTPSLPSVATGVGQESQHDRSLVVPTANSPAQVATHIERGGGLDIHHYQTDQQSVASIAARRIESGVGYRPKLTRLGIRAGNQQVENRVDQLSTFASASNVLCLQALSLEVDSQGF